MKLIVPAMLLGLSVPVLAGFYQFTVTGEVTQSSHAKVTVGDSFMIGYVAESTDLDPRPTVGTYAGTPATATFPNTVIVSQGSSSPGVTVELNRSGGSGIDIVSYSHSGPINAYTFGFSFHFPVGTLGSDALPISLPLSQATSDFFIVGSPDFAIFGHAESYESVEVPEANSLVLILLPVLLWRAGRQR